MHMLIFLICILLLQKNLTLRMAKVLNGQHVVFRSPQQISVHKVTVCFFAGEAKFANIFRQGNLKLASFCF